MKTFTVSFSPCFSTFIYFLKSLRGGERDRNSCFIPQMPQSWNSIRISDGDGKNSTRYLPGYISGMPGSGAEPSRWHSDSLSLLPQLPFTQEECLQRGGTEIEVCPRSLQQAGHDGHLTVPSDERASRSLQGRGRMHLTSHFFSFHWKVK